MKPTVTKGVMQRPVNRALKILEAPRGLKAVLGEVSNLGPIFRPQLLVTHNFFQDDRQI